MGDTTGAIPHLVKIMQGREFKDSEKFQKAKAASKKIKETFSKNSAVKFERVLGFGGFGIVQLWSVLNPDGSATGRAVAIKFPIRGSDARHADTTRSELGWMGVTFRHLTHFVQLADVEPDVPEAEKITNNPNSDSPILVMEALRKCNLYHLITWINEARTWLSGHLSAGTMDDDLFLYHRVGFIPNRVLWKFFFCLTRGVIGMAWPPNGGQGAPPNPLDLYSKWLEHIPPPVPGTYQPPPPTKYIHFDLDPQNILVGEQDAGDHTSVPGLQIADFGLMLEWDDTATNQQKVKRIRYRGKMDWLAPEQRWFQRALDPYYNIGHELNIWAIGLVMFNLLTLGHPSDVDEWRSLPRLVRTTDNQGFEIIMTFGWYLLPPPPGMEGSEPQQRIADYDIDLRMLIARCLADDTNVRPSIIGLHDSVIGGMNESDGRKYQYPDYQRWEPYVGHEYNPMRVPPVESDSLIAKWCTDYFLNAPPPIDRFAGRWDD